MTDLDQQIRAWIDTYRNAYRDGDSRRLAHAIRAVLDLPPMKAAGTGVRDQRSQTAEWMAAGYNQALADVRVEIADRLGIAAPAGTDWSTDTRSPAPTPDKPPTATLGASTGHPCGDVLIGEIVCILTPGHAGDHHADTAAGNCDWGDHGTLTTTALKAAAGMSVEDVQRGIDLSGLTAKTPRDLDPALNQRIADLPDVTGTLKGHFTDHGYQELRTGQWVICQDPTCGDCATYLAQQAQDTP